MNNRLSGLIWVIEFLIQPVANSCFEEQKVLLTLEAEVVKRIWDLFSQLTCMLPLILWLKELGNMSSGVPRKRHYPACGVGDGQVRISVFSFAAEVTLLCKLKRVQNKAIKMM